MNFHRQSNPRRRTTKAVVPAVLMMVLAFSGSACQTAATHLLRAAWSEPVEPFQVAGNIYYVGSSGISSHLIVTDDGLILIDAGTNPMPAMIKENVEKLGHQVTDIQIILSSHAHWDHVEGLAEMKRLSGAQVIALGEDAAAELWAAKAYAGSGVTFDADGDFR